MYLESSDPTLTHVTISGNKADEYGGGMYLYESIPTITNSIIWGNCVYFSCNGPAPSIYIQSGVLPIITYSDIEGGWADEGNIDSDPLFTDPIIDNQNTTDYTLMENSPCIDAGIVTGDMEYCGSAPDMGAFEYITEDCEESTLSGDLNSDGLINVLDVVVLVNIVLGYGEPVDAGDLNGDGVLNVLDVVILVDMILGG